MLSFSDFPLIFAFFGGNYSTNWLLEDLKTYLNNIRIKNLVLLVDICNLETLQVNLLSFKGLQAKKVGTTALCGSHWSTTPYSSLSKQCTSYNM